MDCQKVGQLILALRKEKGMTQKNIADALNISDKTISKWERGLGCPDVSILGELSNLLGVNIEKILQGDLDPNHADGGNMNNIKFYVCPNCENILYSMGKAEVSCCGRKLEALEARKTDEAHQIKVTEVENDYYMTMKHEMTRTHYISFAAYISYDRVLFIKLYPEQNAELRFPKMYWGKLYIYCNRDGLWEKDLK